MARQASPREQGAYKTFTQPRLQRWTLEQEKRIETAARIRSKTFSDFVRDGTMALVQTVEEEQLNRRRRKEEETRSAFVPQLPRAPKPIEIAPLIAPTPAQPEAPPEPVTPTVIIQTAPAAAVASAPPENNLLVSYVLGAKNTVELETRKRLVEKILAESAGEERNRIKKALDEGLRARNATRPELRSGWSILGGLR